MNGIRPRKQVRPLCEDLDYRNGSFFPVQGLLLGTDRRLPR